MVVLNTFAKHQLFLCLYCDSGGRNSQPATFPSEVIVAVVAVVAFVNVVVDVSVVARVNKRSLVLLHCTVGIANNWKFAA